MEGHGLYSCTVGQRDLSCSVRTLHADKHRNIHQLFRFIYITKFHFIITQILQIYTEIFDCGSQLIIQNLNNVCPVVQVGRPSCSVCGT